MLRSNNVYALIICYRSRYSQRSRSATQLKLLHYRLLLEIHKTPRLRLGHFRMREFFQPGESQLSRFSTFYLIIAFLKDDRKGKNQDSILPRGYPKTGGTSFSNILLYKVFVSPGRSSIPKYSHVKKKHRHKWFGVRFF